MPTQEMELLLKLRMQ